LNQQALNDLTYAMSQVTACKGNITGWDLACKTGTWEYGGRVDQNSHAWMVGFDKKLAAAVWVGNKKEEQAIKDKNHADIYGAGLPGQIWKAFMANAMKALNPKKENQKFNPPNFIGNTDPNGSIPSPTPPPAPDPGQQPPVSPSPGNGGITFPTLPTRTRR
jgi:membrane peptidoglycan carboxypeptidase